MSPFTWGCDTDITRKHLQWLQKVSTTLCKGVYNEEFGYFELFNCWKCEMGDFNSLTGIENYKSESFIC